MTKSPCIHNYVRVKTGRTDDVRSSAGLDKGRGDQLRIEGLEHSIKCTFPHFCTSEMGICLLSVASYSLARPRAFSICHQRSSQQILERPFEEGICIRAVV